VVGAGALQKLDELERVLLKLAMAQFINDDADDDDDDDDDDSDGDDDDSHHSGNDDVS
jgi:hypothetical protein